MLELARAADRGDRRAGALDPVRRPGHAARARRHGRPRLHGPRLADLAPGPRRLGGRHRPAPLPDRPVRPVRGPSGRVAVRRRRGRPLDRDRLRLLRRPEASKGWAPEYIDRLSIADDDQSWKFARAWTLGEVDHGAARGRICGSSAVAEHPIDWWGGHADVRRRGARPDPAVVLRGRSQGRPEARP